MDFALSDGTCETAASSGNAKGIMKRLTIAVAGLGVAVGLGFYLNRPKPLPIAPEEPVALVPPAPAGDEPPAAELGTVGSGLWTNQRALSDQSAQPTQTPDAAKSMSGPIIAAAVPGPDASFLSRTVDLLVSPQASYQQKQEAWKQLREAGKLDQAIADLEQRMAGDPRTADYPAALGQAYIKKCATSHDVREQGILAMQADQMFDAALNLDPSNWEARFTKAVAMSYWPPMLNKGDEVIQHFETLIQQQEAQTAQPQFAETYAWLGDQFQKAGRKDDAQAVWQRGAAFFPADEKLRAKLASTP